MERLDQAALDGVLTCMLEQEPLARVVAIAENGLFVPMPSSVPLRGHVVISGASSALDLVVPDDIVVVIETWEAARDAGTAKAAVHPLVAPQMEVELHFVDVTHCFGVYLGFVIGVPDITATSDAGGQAESALRPRYGVMHKNDLAVVTWCDESALRILALSQAELVGRRTLELVHPDDHQRAIANWLDLLGRPGAARRVRLRHRRSDGEWIWFEITNHNLLNDPEHGCILAEMVDISDEMAATEALRAGEELLRQLTEALPVGVVQFDAAGRVVYRNDRLASILGRDLPPALGEADGSSDRPSGGSGGLGELSESVAGVLATGQDADFEAAHGDLDGAARRIDVRLRALRRSDGEVIGAIACLNDITEAAQLREELAHQATFDALTGCLTRRAVLVHLDTMLRSGPPVTVLFIDLDGFKQVNDQHGHAVGDALLRHVGGCLLAHAGPDDVVGRLGGDEFLIVMTTPSDERSVAAAADAAAAALGRPVVIDGVRLSARASIGAAHSPDVADADALVAAADAVMYRTKTERRATART
jgi:diguanylate cyclase (GGDEF)-like protein/PAS domain S-box-containing protein